MGKQQKTDALSERHFVQRAPLIPLIPFLQFDIGHKYIGTNNQPEEKKEFLLQLQDAVPIVIVLQIHCPLFLLLCFHGTSLSRMHILWERRKTHYFLIWEFPQSRALHLPARKHMQMDSQRNLFFWSEILNQILYLASAWFELPFNGHTEKEIISTMQANLSKLQSI